MGGGDGLVLYESGNGVARITLNRPDKRNALNARMLRELAAAIERAASDASVRVALLAGNGPDFCSGVDLAELAESMERTREQALADAQRLAGLFSDMRRAPLPIVAAVHGRALAGGAGLATACDLIVAAGDSQLGYPEVHLGFVPAIVMTILRRKVGEARAFELAAFGDRVGAGEAHALGLVNRVLPAEAFESGARAYAEELARRPASALRLTKGLLYELADLSFDDGLRRGAEVNVEARFTDACREGVRRFLERSAARSGREGPDA